MRPVYSWLGILGSVAVTGLAVPAGAQPVGGEFQINTYTTSRQLTSGFGGRRTVAADASGNFVVVWRSLGQDGSSYGIFGQRYDSAGNKRGSEFRINSFTTSSQTNPAVASDAAGNFIVVWNGNSQDGSQTGVFGQRYDSAGNKRGSEFRVNSYTSGPQQNPAVASDATGNFIVAWNSDSQDGDQTGVFGQRYDSSGNRLGGEFQVNSFTLTEQSNPAVASDAGGNFVVVWQSRYQDGDSWGVFGQRYDNQGGTLGAEFQVNTFTDLFQLSPAVAADAAGTFVVAWTGIGIFGAYSDIFGQRYDSQGGALGAEFRINDELFADKGNASVAFDPDSNFVVVWDNYFYAYPPARAGVFGKRYEASGAPVGFEFRINTYTPGDQEAPSVATTGVDQFVVVWQSDNQDGNLNGILGTQFGAMLHAGDLDRRAKNVGASWRAQVKTLVHDKVHGPVGGALVVLDISPGGIGTCTTTAGGSCEVSVLVSDSVPSLTFTVTNINKGSLLYDAGANHDPDPDSDGTVIVVRQP